MGRLDPPNCTTDDELKLVPFTVSVNAMSPAHLFVGEIVVNVGTGLFTANALLVLRLFVRKPASYGARHY